MVGDDDDGQLGGDGFLELLEHRGLIRCRLAGRVQPPLGIEHHQAHRRILRGQVPHAGPRLASLGQETSVTEPFVDVIRLATYGM